MTYQTGTKTATPPSNTNPPGVKYQDRLFVPLNLAETWYWAFPTGRPCAGGQDPAVDGDIDLASNWTVRAVRKTWAQKVLQAMMLNALPRPPYATMQEQEF